MSFGIGITLLLAAVLLAVSAAAEDWPTFMHDRARSGVSGEALKFPLNELWSYTPPAEPGRAWPNPQPGYNELPKLAFDDATHVAMAGDTVFFGSSVDNGIHAVDARTGAKRWTFFTEGPVRLAPTVSEGRVYAGSDDGLVYCLDAKDGRLVWSARPGPGTTRILGAGRMSSLWPIRTGVLVDAGVAYCGTGIFPARETSVAAFDAATGKRLWQTTTTPKSGEAYVALAPQGYLLATTDQLYVPCGRTAPLAYARADGAARGSMVKTYLIVPSKGVVSGDYGVLVDDLFYLGSQNELHTYTPDGRHVSTLKEAAQVVATRSHYFRLTGPAIPKYGRGPAERVHVITAFDRAACDAAPKRGMLPKEAAQWTFNGAQLQLLVATASHVLVGGSNTVVAVDIATGKAAWTGKVDGLAKGLAVANGQLVVSTENGRLFCFGPGTPAPVLAAKPTTASDARVVAQAEAIVKESGVTRGFALLIGNDAARLAEELARRTSLRIHVAEPDAAKAAAARTALSAAGLYGARVEVDVVPVGATNGLPYPPYFANLVVVDAAALGQGALTGRALLRVLKPHGGVLLASTAATDAAWTSAGVVSPAQLGGAGAWTKLVRGQLPGARDWTHQYADAGNSGSSDDERVRGRPEVLWYGEPGADKMHDRHRRSEAPLQLGGRMFVEGTRQLTKTPLLLSFDAYNGLPYWERELPGAERLDITQDCGNLAASPHGLFVAADKDCHQLDLVTGATRRSFPVPPGPDGKSGTWAYVAAEGDLLIGSTSAGFQFSRTLFAYDVRTGALKWRYDSAAMRNSTFAVQGGKVFLVEHRGQTNAPRVLTLMEAHKELGKPKPAKPDGPPPPYLRTVVALDLATGKPLWARDHDLTKCGNWTGSLCLTAKNGVVLLSGVYSAYGAPKGDEGERRALALSATDGAQLWNEAIGNRVRPVLVGEHVIGRPKAYDLHSGATVMKPGPKGLIPWSVPPNGACGQMSASAGMLFYRDGYTVMRDAATGGTLMNFTGMRPGCLINIIPAGGVIVQVEASSGCTCYHAIQSTVAFVPPGAE
jgi:outer membrane protein assembly factor BamB